MDSRKVMNPAVQSAHPATETAAFSRIAPIAAESSIGRSGSQRSKIRRLPKARPNHQHNATEHRKMTIFAARKNPATCQGVAIFNDSSIPGAWRKLMHAGGSSHLKKYPPPHCGSKSDDGARARLAIDPEEGVFHFPPVAATSDRMKRSGHAAIRSALRGVRSGLAANGSAFRGVRSGLAAIRSAFRCVRSGLAAIRSAFWGVRSELAAIRSALRGVRSGFRASGFRVDRIHFQSVAITPSQNLPRSFLLPTVRHPPPFRLLAASSPASLSLWLIPSKSR